MTPAGDKPGRTPHALRSETTGVALTRRALIGALAAPLVVGVAPVPREPDSAILHLWRRLDVALRRRDRATARCDRLEAALVRRLGYPRVRLPSARGKPVLYAAEPSDIDRAVGFGRLRAELRKSLRRRRRAWDHAARATGFTRAVAAEDAAARVTRQATKALLRAPATTVAAIRLKLAIIVAIHAPGAANRDTSPWRELRQLLIDFDGLIGADETPRRRFDHT